MNCVYSCLVCLDKAGNGIVEMSGQRHQNKVTGSDIQHIIATIPVTEIPKQNDWWL